jgi:hypothetical protein
MPQHQCHPPVPLLGQYKCNNCPYHTRYQLGIWQWLEDVFQLQGAFYCFCLTATHCYWAGCGCRLGLRSELYVYKRGSKGGWMYGYIG